MSINPNFGLIGFMGWEYRHVFCYSEVLWKRYPCNMFMFSFNLYLFLYKGWDNPIVPIYSFSLLLIKKMSNQSVISWSYVLF